MAEGEDKESAATAHATEASAAERAGGDHKAPADPNQAAAPDARAVVSNDTTDAAPSPGSPAAPPKAAKPEALANRAAAPVGPKTVIPAAKPASETREAAPIAETASAGARDKPLDESDSGTWQVPIVCKDCGKGYAVAYRHFQSGVVFHCPWCRGSFVPNSTIYRMVTQAFESFYSRRKREREEFEKRGDKSGEAEFRHKQERELEAFSQKLDEMAREMKPAGKMVKPKGLASMFT